MERIRQISGGTYPLSVRTVDDEGTDGVVAAPQVKVYASDGVQVGTTATPTAAPGTLSWTVPAGVMTALDTYTLVWTGTGVEFRQTVELVGGFLFEVADLRAFDPAFADAARYPGALVRAARTAAEQRLEDACRRAFVPRARRLRAVGRGLARLAVPDRALRSLEAATEGPSALSAQDLSEITVREWGALDKPAGRVWAQDLPVSLLYQHGLDAPSGPESQAAMLLAREYLTRSNLSSRAVVEQTDVGFFRLSVAGRDKPTGIPEVDAVIEAARSKLPLIG